MKSTDCRAKAEGEKERERFEKAEKIPADQYNGWLYCDGTGNEGYSRSVEDLLDDAESREIEIPAYAWACKPTEFVKADVDALLDDITENAYEDFDESNIHGLAELKQACEVFNEANKEHVSYSPDYSRAVILPKTSEDSQ